LDRLKDCISRIHSVYVMAPYIVINGATLGCMLFYFRKAINYAQETHLNIKAVLWNQPQEFPKHCIFNLHTRL
jgi:hypothetical protein